MSRRAAAAMSTGRKSSAFRRKRDTGNLASLKAVARARPVNTAGAQAIARQTFKRALAAKAEVKYWSQAGNFNTTWDDANTVCTILTPVPQATVGATDTTRQGEEEISSSSESDSERVSSSDDDYEGDGGPSGSTSGHPRNEARCSRPSSPGGFDNEELEEPETEAHEYRIRSGPLSWMEYSLGQEQDFDLKWAAEHWEDCFGKSPSPERPLCHPYGPASTVLFREFDWHNFRRGLIQAHAPRGSNPSNRCSGGPNCSLQVCSGFPSSRNTKNYLNQCASG